MPIEPGALDQTHHRSTPLARTQGAGKQPIVPANGDGPDLIRNMVVIDRQMPVTCQPDQLIPLCGLA